MFTYFFSMAPQAAGVFSEPLKCHVGLSGAPMPLIRLPNPRRAHGWMELETDKPGPVYPTGAAHAESRHGFEKWVPEQQRASRTRGVCVEGT